MEKESRLKVDLVEDVGEAEMEKMGLQGMEKFVEAEKAKFVEQPFQPKVYKFHIYSFFEIFLKYLIFCFV